MPVDILAHIFREKSGSVAPAAELEGIIAGYYWYTCRQSRQPLWATLDGEPALLFLLDAPYSIQFSGTHAVSLEHAFFCCYGLQNTYIQAWPQDMRLLVVKFTCNGLYQLLRQPLPSMAQGPFVPVTGIWGKAGLQLAENIRKAGTQQAQATVLDAFLSTQLPAYKQAGYLVQTAVDHIRQSKGQLTVQELCQRLRVNYKWLERNFRNQLGITPKTYINTIRFLHAYFSVGSHRQGLTAVALQHGYYDQNHFIKDFRKHTGKAPSQG